MFGCIMLGCCCCMFGIIMLGCCCYIICCCCYILGCRPVVGSVECALSDGSHRVLQVDLRLILETDLLETLLHLVRLLETIHLGLCNWELIWCFSWRQRLLVQRFFHLLSCRHHRHVFFYAICKYWLISHGCCWLSGSRLCFLENLVVDEVLAFKECF